MCLYHIAQYHNAGREAGAQPGSFGSGTCREGAHLGGFGQLRARAGCNRILLVRSSSELVVHCTGETRERKPESVPCPAILAMRKSTIHQRCQVASAQLEHTSKNMDTMLCSPFSTTIAQGGAAIARHASAPRSPLES